MHRDLVPGDVLEDAFVGGRRAANVVFGRQSVDRHHDLQPAHAGPFGWNRPNRAGHDLGMNPARGELRQDLPELAIAHQRLAADDRDVQRLVTIDHRHEPR